MNQPQSEQLRAFVAKLQKQSAIGPPSQVAEAAISPIRNTSRVRSAFQPVLPRKQRNNIEEAGIISAWDSLPSAVNPADKRYTSFVPSRQRFVHLKVAISQHPDPGLDGQVGELWR